MGTRSLICVVYKGKFVIVQYSQFDGYPENQGKTIYDFLSIPANIERLQRGLEHTHTYTAQEGKKIQAEISRLLQFKENMLSSSANFESFTKGEYAGLEEKEKSQMSQGEIHRFEDWKGKILESIPEGKSYNYSRFWLEGRTGEPLITYWPSLSRDTGAGILEIVASSSSEHSIPIQISLNYEYCEYAYVVDLDERKFEVFASSEEKARSGSTRFNDIENFDSTHDGVPLVPRFIKSFEFSNLPATSKEFVDICYDILTRLSQTGNLRTTDT